MRCKDIPRIALLPEGNASSSFRCCWLETLRKSKTFAFDCFIFLHELRHRFFPCGFQETGLSTLYRATASDRAGFRPRVILRRFSKKQHHALPPASWPIEAERFDVSQKANLTWQTMAGRICFQDQDPIDVHFVMCWLGYPIWYTTPYKCNL